MSAPWSKIEDAHIRAEFPGGGWSACALMDRTPMAIIRRAEELNVRLGVFEAPAASPEGRLLAIMREDVRVLAERSA